jgi:hypothetical protein
MGEWWPRPLSGIRWLPGLMPESVVLWDSLIPEAKRVTKGHTRLKTSVPAGIIKEDRST